MNPATGSAARFGRRLRILYLADASSPHVAKFVAAMAGEAEVAVASLATHAGGARLPAGARLAPLPAPTGTRADYLIAARAAVRAVRRFKPDVVHSQYASSYGFLGALCAGRARFVVSVWGSDVTEFPDHGPFQRRLLAWTLRRADLILATSEFLRGETGRFLGGSSPRIVTTPFPVQGMFFAAESAIRARNAGASCVRMLLAKHLHPNYNHAGLLRIFRALADRHPNIPMRLDLIGEGPLREEIGRGIQALGLAGRVHLLGARPPESVRGCLDATDLVCIPSWRDAYGVFAVEAQAMGVPVVVSNREGLPGLIEEGVTGFARDPEAEGAFVDALSPLVADRARRVEMGLAAARRAREIYSMSNFKAVLTGAYADLLGAGGAPVRRRAPGKGPGTRIRPAAGGISIRPAGAGDIAALARCHAAAFPGEFLTALGPCFLGALYGHLAADPEGICLAAFDERGDLAGFAAGGPPRVRGRFMRRVAPLYAGDVLAAAWRDAAVRRRLRVHLVALLSRVAGAGARVLRAASPSTAGPDHASLLSIGVDPEFRGRGVGMALMGAFEVEAARRGFALLRLSVRPHNGGAIALYRRAGWRVVREEPGGIYFEKRADPAR